MHWNMPSVGGLIFFLLSNNSVLEELQNFVNLISPLFEG